jgi:glyoxylase-like metal-dependent hydrolase (beta-lactamase superfamily II)
MSDDIPFDKSFDLAPGQAEQVMPGVRRLLANNPGPFTFKGTGTYIVGRGEVAVIDPGPDMADHLQALLATVAGERVTHILTTHTHADHSPLSVALARETGATIYGRPDPSLGATEVRVEEAADNAFRPDVVVADGQRLTGPGWTLEAIATPGHISNHVCYALPEENALFSGDHVMGWSTTVISPPHGDMTDYYASLDKVAARGFATLWPTHGPPITQVAPFLAEYKAHRLDRERQILDQLAKGHHRIPEMIPEMYAAVDPRLHPAAANSVLAHMIHLTRQGVIATDGPPGPGSEYRLAGRG